jgi:outer membrane receptor protein involved in Fe transport
MLTVPSNTRTDLSFYYDRPRWDVALNVNNATDISYIAGGDAPTDVAPGSPRKITASFRMKL